MKNAAKKKRYLIILIVKALLVSSVIVSVALSTNSCGSTDTYNGENGSLDSIASTNSSTNESVLLLDISGDNSNDSIKIVYADYFSGTSGGGIHQEADELWPPRNFYKPCFWEKIENDKDALYFVSIKPQCLEFIYYKHAITATKINTEKGIKYSYSPLTFKKYKEAFNWIIEHELSFFKNLGINATIHWYGYKNDELSLKGSDEDRFFSPLNDDDVGEFDYFYTAYVSGNTLLKYEQTVRNDLERISQEYSKSVIDYYYNNYSTEIDDSDILALYSMEALYGNVVKDGWSSYVYYDNCDYPSIIEDIKNKWQTHISNGVRSAIPCGGVIGLLPDGYTESEIIFKYYASSLCVMD